ncbi:hypothetical protein FNO01nite_30160 [Flavobacterium noncentrifugens]|uniref:ORC1/DEAH AAA+ ATPase domain-containing protein n=1 Tax=Flavobacterium noncentrifugens TaxID=1128970 RepID=A0A1G9BRR7_9FLAO|nr:ATP-binding protein [Flavobacterium noncentrifugens]GEP52344.1 hypothetical protein FNO01nite_30160 [Flavobacterium noncentrifugens]SDK42137.1 hypothetical protein SAMN04487935_3328 [Flavobacterium noncentrifugens]
MDTPNKEQITADLIIYCSRFESQSQAANSLKDVSSATISQIINKNWNNIADKMWLTVSAQIGTGKRSIADEWIYVETVDYKELNQFLNDAKTNSLSMGIIGRAGSCKSKTFELYAKANRNTYVLTCNEYWDRKQFLEELLTVMGHSCSGLKVSEMMREITRRIITRIDPIIILDEYDKLPDSVLLFYITLYNYLEDRCGFILCATDHLKKRVERGLRLNKKGYNEIYSRIGRRFIELNGLTSTDVMQACVANGVSDPEEIKKIWNSCEYDMRRVKRMIHAYKKQKLNGE